MRRKCIAEARQPRRCLRPVFADQATHALDGARPTRDDRELSVEPFEVELAHDAVVALLHEEHARARLELLFDKLEFAFAETKSFDVLICAGVNVWKEDLRWCLFDNRTADGALQDVACALRRKTHHAI